MSLSSAQANLAYITNEKDNTVSVIDIKKKKVINTVKVGQRPRGIIMSKDGKLVLICASDDDRVEVRDAKTMKLKYHLPSGPDPELFILSPDDDTFYIANEDDAMVTVVDMNDKMIIDDIPVGVEPEGMGLTNNGKILVNTSETTNMAHFINAETLEIVENVLVDARPRVACLRLTIKKYGFLQKLGEQLKLLTQAPKKLLIPLDLRFLESMKKVFSQLVSDILTMVNTHLWHLDQPTELQLLIRKQKK